MTFVVRAAAPDDLEAIYAMAKSTGGGFTNLPPDRDALTAKLARAAASFAHDADAPGDDLFFFVLEDIATGQVRGTCQIFGLIGAKLPFYSYRLGTLTQTSYALRRTFRAEMLTLSTDLDGSSEVGGLYLHPGERSAGTGALLARSRYLFIRRHRARFAKRMIAELRGVIDDAGGSPFWDGLAGRFFGMGFREADEFNAIQGNQFIADLMPKHPIYLAMLPESAQHAVGVPHPTGRAALRMLEAEGFRHDHYIDIFDGGPTVCAATDSIATLRDARESVVAAVADDVGGVRGLCATGRLATYRAIFAEVALAGEDAAPGRRAGDRPDAGVMLHPAAAAALGVTVGDVITHVKA